MPCWSSSVFNGVVGVPLALWSSLASVRLINISAPSSSPHHCVCLALVISRYSILPKQGLPKGPSFDPIRNTPFPLHSLYNTQHTPARSSPSLHQSIFRVWLRRCCECCTSTKHFPGSAESDGVRNRCGLAQGIWGFSVWIKGRQVKLQLVHKSELDHR